jgi:hypothetical protein
MMFGETADATPAPGDGPVEWRRYSQYPVGVGVACVGLAAVIGLAADNGAGQAGTALPAVRAALCIAGLFAMGLAVWLRPRAVPLLALASATCILARMGFSPDWDSGRLLAGFLAIVTGIGAALMALPQVYRRVGVSLIILFHFGSLLAAVTGPNTGGNAPPWLSQAASVYVYRPYSQCVYLINAYHFYSPEPGPASQVWFCITYADGSARWHKLPRRPEDMTDPLALEYYRRLSLTEQLVNPPPMVPDEAKRRRYQKSVGDHGILRHPELSDLDQYRPTSDTVRLFLIPSFVRHVAKMPLLQHDKTDPATGKPYAITKIKVYRTEHRILHPSMMQMADPYSPSTYLPYYQGEFNATDGQPTDPNDPMLFWLVPIFYQPIDPANVKIGDNPKTAPDKFRLYDGLKAHTGFDHTLK